MTIQRVFGLGSVLAAVFGACSAACGPPSAPAAGPGPVPAGAGTVVPAKDLGTVDPTACSTVGFVARSGAGCREVRSRNAQGGTQAQAATAVNDGDACTVWNSGGVPPQFITVDLEKDVPITGLLLVPDMTPPEGDVEHAIEGSSDGDTWTPIATVKMHMVDNHVYAVAFPAKVTSRFVRVTTRTSLSWVAWAEVAPLFCGG